MLTQCSQCKKTYNISVEELRLRRNALFCPNCEDMLSRLQVLSAEFFDSETNQHTHSLLWGLGCLACIGLFLAQVYWVEGDKLRQNPDTRVWLEKICQSLPCQLPPYKNLDEFEILHSDFQPNSNQAYLFQAVISNQAIFTQAYPAIKLNLLDFEGQPFAQRIFYPTDYLPANSDNMVPAAESVEINLQIALPTEKIGGYTFELI